MNECWSGPVLYKQLALAQSEEPEEPALEAPSPVTDRGSSIAANELFLLHSFGSLILHLLVSRRSRLNIHLVVQRRLLLLGLLLVMLVRRVRLLGKFRLRGRPVPWLIGPPVPCFHSAESDSTFCNIWTEESFPMIPLGFIGLVPRQRMENAFINQHSLAAGIVNFDDHNLPPPQTEWKWCHHNNKNPSQVQISQHKTIWNHTFLWIQNLGTSLCHSRASILEPGLHILPMNHELWNSNNSYFSASCPLHRTHRGDNGIHRRHPQLNLQWLTNSQFLCNSVVTFSNAWMRSMQINTYDGIQAA